MNSKLDKKPKMKKPRLVKNWRTVLKHSWSLRLIALAGVLSGVEAALPLLSAYFIQWQIWIAIATPFVIGGAFVARLLAQSKMEGKDNDKD